ncbi:hypothetical protein Moror_9878 [Moniliophthora roreri MCA 2997]|uniref:DUF3752 domain-containing protein n=1 Tax=Moniliophthora roreri (strain MCA 2997) TaxID=1381753 RepID=V2WHY5_MONRO|nr:hypothetical protein Moror_9878 [Moniliophthora roreri MCA 2997]
MSSIGPQLPPHLQHLNDNNSNDSDSGEEESTVAGPQIPPELLKVRSESDEEEDDDDYTPALPPDLVASRSSGPEAGPSIANRKIQGPVLPSSNPGYDDDSDDDVGPMPLPPGYEGLTEVDGVKQFLEQEEKRRKNIEEAAKPKALKRDEWMLVPPSSSDLLGTLDPKKLSKGRQFSKSAAPAKNNDMSLWTETPAERQQRLADEVSGKKRKAVNAEPTISPEEAMEARKRRKRDEVIRQSVLDHTKNVRGGALVDTHAKSMEKDDKEDPNAKAIWDHSRDMSIGGRLMDDSQRNKLIRDARGLGDRFSTGKSGGFL